MVPKICKELLLFVAFTVNVVFNKVRRSVVKTVKLPFWDESLTEMLIDDELNDKLVWEYEPKIPLTV